MKTKHIVILICVFVIMVIFSPIIINEMYKGNDGYMTLWGAKDVLAYLGDVIGTVGTIFVGIIAIKQSNQANDISNKLLRIQEMNSAPFLNFDVSNSEVRAFSNHEIDILIGLRNETNNVINILDVSNLEIESVLANDKGEISFCKNWTKHYSVLPHQTRQINFYIENKKTDPDVLKTAEFLYSAGLYQLTCRMTLKIEYVNLSEVFIQDYEFMIQMAAPKGKTLITDCFVKFDSIENSINEYIKGDQ